LNFLAHLHLAHRHDHALAGALLGDFVKGNLQEHIQEHGGSYCADWVASIRFHRQIDTFTDSHPLVVAARQRFNPPFRRYAGIIIDLMFDHFLVQSWSQHADEPLDEFEVLCYQYLERDESVFPASALTLNQHIRKHRLLSGYGDLAIIDRALGGVGRRLSRANSLHQCLPAIRECEAQLRADFTEFYPQLITACMGFDSRVAPPAAERPNSPTFAVRST
jgi:acyl carrier protein phosphodiesterase